MPAGRNIHEIFGALENPTPAAQTISADWYDRKSDVEVLAFLQMTNSKPVVLLVVLHRDATGSPNTPPPYPLEAYFPAHKFESPLQYDNHGEDRDALVRNIAGVAGRRMLTKDHTFEERKYKIRQRIARQQEILRSVKLEHKRKFLVPPAVIVDSEDEDHCYIRNLRNPKPTTGARIVKERQVIAAWRRASRLQRAMGVGRIVSKVSAINSAQYAWEQLNL